MIFLQRYALNGLKIDLFKVQEKIILGLNGLAYKGVIDFTSKIYRVDC
jgi:hypothetical protein